MQLLHLYFTQPRKDKESFDAFITRTKQWVDDSKRNPATEFNETINYIKMCSYRIAQFWQITSSETVTSEQIATL